MIGSSILKSDIGSPSSATDVVGDPSSWTLSARQEASVGTLRFQSEIGGQGSGTPARGPFFVVVVFCS